MEAKDLITEEALCYQEKIGKKRRNILQPWCETIVCKKITPVVKTPRKALTVQQKTEILKFVDENRNMKRKDVAAKYNMSNSTLSDILKKRAYVEKVAKEHSSAIKRLKISKYERIDKVLIQWFYQASANNINLNGVIVKEKAKEIANELGMYDFRASNGWIGRFKNRYDVLHKKTSGKSRTILKDTVDCWNTDILPGIVAAYHPKDIFSVDIFGLSSNTLSGCNFLDGSNITERNIGIFCRDPFVILLCCNSDGSDRLRPLVIGTNEHLERESTLPYTYNFNTSAWMTGEDFKRWSAQIDAKMIAENRKILLFVDNAAAHSDVLDLTNVKLILSPPNTTSCLLPIYKDILKTTEQHMRLLLTGSLNYQTKSQIFKAITLFVDSWRTVKTESIKNCFIKSGFLTNPNKCQELAAVDVKRECPSPSEDELLLDPVFIKAEVTYEECDNDYDLLATQGQTTDNRVDTEEVSNEFEEETPTVSTEEALASIANIKMFMAQNDGFEVKHWNDLAELENIIFIKNALNRRRRMTILEK